MFPTNARIPAGQRCTFLAVCGWLLALSGASTPLFATDIINPQPQAYADAWVGSEAPNAKHNGNTLTTSDTKDIYIRFQLPVSVIGKAPPRVVKLRLWKTSGPSTTVTVNVYAANNDWDEAAVNWNNHPTVDGNLLLASQAVDLANGWVSFEIAVPSNPTASTAYISGAGDYTFCVRTSSTSEVNFSSKEGGTAPRLYLEVPSENLTTTSRPLGHDDEFRRKPTEVIVEGERYIDRYIALNGGVGTSGGNAALADVENVGYFDVTKAPYFAKAVSDGSVDSTLAIQRCINEARDARVAVYFPPPDAANKAYIVSDTLECVQGIIDYDDSIAPPKPPGVPNPTIYPNETYNERWSDWEFSCLLMGPSALKAGQFTPRLELKGQAAGFTDSNVPKPMLHFWSRAKARNYNPANQAATEPEGLGPEDNFVAGNYNHLIRNLDIKLNQNAGAAGIDMMGAQGNAIEKLTIDANGAYAGLMGLPCAGGGTTNVTIQGGRFGIITSLNSKIIGYTPLLTHCTLLDDSNSTHQKYSIVWNGIGPMVLVGCKIVGKGIWIGDENKVFHPKTPDEIILPGSEGEAYRGNLSIVDSTIELTDEGGPAVMGWRSLYLRNVYLKNVNPIANITTPDGDAGSVNLPSVGPWYHVSEYYEGAKLDQYTGGGQHPDDGLPAEITPSYTDPTNSNPNALTATASGVAVASGFDAAAQKAFLDRHAMPDVPMWDAANVINVKTWSGTKAMGDNVANDLPAIQAAINAANTAGSGQVVFIPRGEYSMKNTLWLKADTVLFGLHKNISRLKASEAPGSVFMGTTLKPLVQSPTGAGATTRLADLMLLQRMTTPSCYLLDWQAGGGSVVQNIIFDRRIVGSSTNIDFPLIKISGNGGGCWFTFQHQSVAGQNENANSNYRNLLIDGTTQPLKFYMLNTETDSDNIYAVEIKGSSNIDVYQSKFEGKKSPSVRMANSSDIRWIGVGGNAYTDAFISGNKADSEAFMEIYNCHDFLVSSIANQANVQPSTPVHPQDFYRLKETIVPGGGNPNTYIVLPGQKQAVVYRRDQPTDSN